MHVYYVCDTSIITCTMAMIYTSQAVDSTKQHILFLLSSIITSAMSTILIIWQTVSPLELAPAPGLWKWILHCCPQKSTCHVSQIEAPSNRHQSHLEARIFQILKSLNAESQINTGCLYTVGVAVQHIILKDMASCPRGQSKYSHVVATCKPAFFPAFLSCTDSWKVQRNCQ